MTSEAKGQSWPSEESGSSAFTIEQHGIDFIPHDERTLRLRDLFWIWFGANVIYVYVVDGVLIVGFGLSFWPAMAVVLLGNAFYALLGLTSIAGPRAGTAMLVVSRAAFGIVGNATAAFLSWLTAVGWEAVNIVIGTLSLVELVQLAGVHANNMLKLLCLLGIILMTFGVTIFGHAMITLANRVLSYILGFGTLVLGIYIVPKINLNAHPHPLAGISGTGAFLLALLVMTAAPVSWLNCGSDYSRYLPKKTSGPKIVLATMLGGLIPSVLIAFVGVAAATATDMTNPIGGLQRLLPSWFFAIYLAVIVGGTVTNNFLNTYSSSMSLLTLGLKMKRHKAVFIDATLGTLLSVYALFVSNFTNSFVNFLSLTVLWLMPWCGVYLADSLLRKGEYDEIDLHRRTGLYWYRKGWNIPALAWFAAGMIVGSLFSSNTLWDGPFVRYLGGGDLSLFVSFAVAFLGYWLTRRGRSNVATTTSEAN
ncbi:MAG: cytosine or purine or uracil or thiamine or allantoin permease [Acidobacteria bacterium]|nr:cytosine or purine or uracil or thiamine or allantoin permease [Acidobacteriota bacterium]